MPKIKLIRVPGSRLQIIRPPQKFRFIDIHCLLPAPHSTALLFRLDSMPVPLLAEGFERGLSGIPYAWTLIKSLPFLAVLFLLKLYFGGARCRSERLMHGKVVMVTVRRFDWFL